MTHLSGGRVAVLLPGCMLSLKIAIRSALWAEQAWRVFRSEDSNGAVTQAHHAASATRPKGAYKVNSPCSPQDIRRDIGRSGAQILACCVLHNLETDDYEAVAVVSADGGREVRVSGWSVFLLRPDAPLSEHVLGCRLGDIFLCYQVVSVNGGPILPEAERTGVYQRLCQEGDTTSRFESPDKRATRMPAVSR
jgi:hypothetical protein